MIDGLGYAADTRPSRWLPKSVCVGADVSTNLPAAMAHRIECERMHILDKRRAHCAPASIARFSQPGIQGLGRLRPQAAADQQSVAEEERHWNLVLCVGEVQT